MTDEAQQQTRNTTPEEDIRELYSRTAKLNDAISALLSPAWGSEAGIIPTDHPLYVGEEPSATQEEQGAPVDWQAIARDRERELKQVGEARHRAEIAVAELAQALRLTLEYVGEELLPPVDGWSWYDALRRHAPHELPHAPHNGPERPDAGAETPGGGNGRQTGVGGRETLREQYAAALKAELTHYARSDIDPGTGSDVGDQVATVLAVRDAELEQLREQLAARDAALAACTAQLVHDQAALARLRQGLADVIADMRGTTGARHWIAALDSVLNPAHDGGPAKEATR